LSRALLEVDGLSVSYPLGPAWLRVVRGIDLRISTGETMALVGETGCGKSSAALALAGLLGAEAQVLHRRFEFEGRPLSSRADWAALYGTRLAMVFQDARGSLNPVLTVGAHFQHTILTHFDILRKEARDRACQLLAEAGLPDADRVMGLHPFELSGGMCQRVAIALALCGNPALLIADEPTSALDPTVQLQVLALLHDLRRQRGLALFLISHDLALVAGIADRVAVMYHGTIVEQGPALDVLRTPAHPYSRLLAASLPSIGSKAAAPLPAISGTPPSAAEEFQGCPFEPRCPESDLERCRRQAPPLVQLEGDREAACVRAV
jgi:oligopeptide/dipeptide ABC transporter ATP-binding protein